MHSLWSNVNDLKYNSSQLCLHSVLVPAADSASWNQKEAKCWSLLVFVMKSIKHCRALRLSIGQLQVSSMQRPPQEIWEAAENLNSDYVLSPLHFVIMNKSIMSISLTCICNGCYESGHEQLCVKHSAANIMWENDPHSIVTLTTNLVGAVLASVTHECTVDQSAPHRRSVLASCSLRRGGHILGGMGQLGTKDCLMSTLTKKPTSAAERSPWRTIRHILTHYLFVLASVGGCK